MRRVRFKSEFLGGTTDDAAGGEGTFDKVSASLLGLGYPGGPEIERVARDRNPTAFAFPRSFVRDERLLLSFSGAEDGRSLRGFHGQNAYSICGEPEPRADR